MELPPRPLDLIDISRYPAIEEKGIVTYALPLEIGCLVQLDVHYNSGESIPLGTIIRWAILYELLSIMEHSNKTNFEVNKNNSIPFVTEWLDDLVLLIWELHGEVYGNSVITNFVCWDGKELKNYPYVLKYCKHCFEEIEKPIPINSLHHSQEKDCLKNYNRDKNFKRNFGTVNKIVRKLSAISRKIEDNDRAAWFKDTKPCKFYPKDFITTANKAEILPRKVLISELNNILKESSKELVSIAKEWHSRLRKKWFYDKPNFNPIVEITDRNKDLYCPMDRRKEYSELTKLMTGGDPEIEDMKDVFCRLRKSYSTQPLTYMNLLRRFFYESNKYFYVSKNKA